MKQSSLGESRTLETEALLAPVMRPMTNAAEANNRPITATTAVCLFGILPN